jgi:hypothetical protein
MNTNAIERQRTNSGIASTVGSKRIQKDRQRRSHEQMQQNGQEPPDSDSRQNFNSKPHYFAGDMQEDIRLKNEIGETFRETVILQRNQRANSRKQGMQVDVII